MAPCAIICFRVSAILKKEEQQVVNPRFCTRVQFLKANLLIINGTLCNYLF
jgi:hypothetical protein